MKKITIYTDGACSGNPGPGGWGAILEYKGVRKEISGGEAETTNNRMELMGIIRALEQLKEPCDITFCSDSKYVMDGLSKGWAKGWRARGWVKSEKKPGTAFGMPGCCGRRVGVPGRLESVPKLSSPFEACFLRG